VIKKGMKMMKKARIIVTAIKMKRRRRKKRTMIFLFTLINFYINLRVSLDGGLRNMEKANL
jgi:hypothetical protein